MFSNESESPNTQAGLAPQEGPVAGNGHTTETDIALKAKIKQLEDDLVRAIEINEELYNKALELQDRNAELEDKVSELEQEAETLAMQLQNSWHLGYQKGQSDTLAKIEKEAALAPLAQEKPSQESSTSLEVLCEAIAIADKQPKEEEEDEDDEKEDTQKNLESQEREPEEQDEIHSEEISRAAPSKVTAQSETQEIHLHQEQPVSPQGNYNVILENRAPINSGDIVSKLSWKEIETVYQYSTVAGRPGTNLYFEPYSTHQENVWEPSVTREATSAETEDRSQLEPAPVLQTPPTPAKELSKAQSSTARKIDNIWASDPLEYDPETSTFEGLESVPTVQASKLEAADELDLEKLDIFEGLEDLEDLKSIEVIEDVVLPDLPPPVAASAAPPQPQSITTPEPTSSKAINEQDLRDLIKLRIKNIQDDQIDSKSAMAAVSAPGSQPPQPAQPPKDPSPLDIPRSGVRNKFIGGKATTETAPPTPTPVAAAPKALPPEIRKACMLLGLRQEELTEHAIREAWKKQITQVHPDLEGGDHESAIYLNSAKEQLLKWLSDSTPKLGKKFGAKQEPNPTKTPFTMKGPGSDPHKK
jgi:hypothetical protein